MGEFRLIEESRDGTRRIVGTFLKPELPLVKQVDARDTNELLRAAHRLIETVKPSPGVSEKSTDIPDCVVFAPLVFLGDLEDFYAEFWSRKEGLNIEVVNIAEFGYTEEMVRDGIRTAIAGYVNLGVERFHLVGDANDWAPRTAYYDSLGYPPPYTLYQDTDIIPTFYSYDDDYLAYHLPYYSTDFPYCDIDDDGFADVSVARWPVSTRSALLARIIKMIVYNQSRVGSPSGSNIDMLALVYDQDYQDISGDVAAATANAAVGRVPSSLNWTVSWGLSTAATVGVEDYARNLWTETQPEVVLITSPHSDRYRPNLMLNESVAQLEEGYSAIVVTTSCMAADFARNDYTSYPDIVRKAPVELYGDLVDRGAIGWIGPMAITTTATSRIFAEEMFASLAEESIRPVVDRFIEGRNAAIRRAGGNPRIQRSLRTFVYIGDPFTRLENQPEPGGFQGSSHFYAGQIVGEVNSASSVDYDGDGLLDLYLACSNGPNDLLRGNGTGTFDRVLVGDGQGIDWGGNTTAVAWGDYDNDGDWDVYLINGGGSSEANVLLSSDVGTGGGFSPVTDGAYYDFNTADGTMAAWVDFDTDGLLDLVVGGGGAIPTVFSGVQNAQTGSVILQRREIAGVTDRELGDVLVFGDYNGDGMVDIYSYIEGSGSVLLKNEGNWQFADRSSAMPEVTLGGVVLSAVWADWDNDGDQDLTIATEDRTVLLGNSGGVFTETLGFDIGRGAYGRIVWADVDHDGDLDLISTDEWDDIALDHICSVWENHYPIPLLDRRESVVIDHVMGEYPVPQAFTVGDFTGDGAADLFVLTDFEGGLYVNPMIA